MSGNPFEVNGKIFRPTMPTILDMITANGSFQPIILPADTNITDVCICVHDGSDTDFTGYSSNPPVFHLTFDDVNWSQHVGSFSFTKYAQGGDTICKVRAQSLKKIAVIVAMVE